MTSPLVDEAIVKPSDVLGDKYRVERVIGMGGMGIVVAVRHIDLRTRFALKIMRPEAARDQESVERFLREARAAVQLKSEHCVQVIDVGRLDNGSPYMVMEFLVGRDLGELVAQEGARSPAEAVDYVLQACEGVAEAHARGIVHRDLKPQNLFITTRVDGTPLVKVLDFGLAKSLATTKEARALTQTTAVMGSPVYMSPEQMRASRLADTRSDTWSLGVCLHELLTGRPPFEGATFPELCSMVLNEPPSPMPSDIPRGLTKIVNRCLEKNPAKRFANVAELAEALEGFAAVRGAASRVRAVLEARHEALESLPPPSMHADPNAETRSATTMDTVRRPPVFRGRGRALMAAAAVAIASVTVIALLTRAPRPTIVPEHDSRSAGSPGDGPPPPAATPVPAPVDAPRPPAVGDPALSAAPASPSAPDLSRHGHSRPGPTRRPLTPAPAAPLPAAPPAASAPLLKPKTSEF
jgi:serine/threonine-protein kinase